MLTCPHCSAGNVDSSQFCESCGLALPTPGMNGARVVKGKEFAASDAGRDLQLVQLGKQARSAKNIMLTLGILQLAGAAALFALSAGMSSQDAMLFRVLGAVLGAIGLLYLGLALWALRSPLAASIVGLVFYVTLNLVGAVVSPVSISRGVIVKIIVIGVMAKAISAGLKHRELKRHLQSHAT